MFQLWFSKTLSKCIERSHQQSHRYTTYLQGYLLQLVPVCTPSETIGMGVCEVSVCFTLRQSPQTIFPGLLSLGIPNTASHFTNLKEFYSSYDLVFCDKLQIHLL